LKGEIEKIIQFSKMKKEIKKIRIKIDMEKIIIL
jgi:hypothetical protein